MTPRILIPELLQIIWVVTGGRNIYNRYYNRFNIYITEDKIMTLESIFSQIEKSTGIELSKNVHKSVNIIDNDVFYVQPAYSEIKRNNNAKFVIFSAPGASGKSALARYIVSQYGGIYWDLSQIELGENSFHGTLLRALGQDGFVDFFNQLKQGRGVLAIDAFDEAEMISGRGGIEFLLNDLNETTEANETPSVVLFARTESALFLVDYCVENNISYVQYEIGFFEEYNAKEFVKRKIEADGKKITNVVIECIEQQFNVIKKLLGQSEETKTFLGYAPVLEALAKAYDERNTIRLLGQLKKDDVSSTQIVYSILEYLLDREHDKVCSALKEKWQGKYPEFEEWDKIYSKKEQIIRIIEYILLDNVEKESMYDDFEIPNELYVEYYEAIKRFLPQHPFLQNLMGKENVSFTGPAFRDYIVASLLADEKYEYLAQDYFSMKNQNIHVSSQLLIDFYYYISKENAHIQGKIFNVLYDSFKAKETAIKHALVNVIQNEEDIDVLFELRDITKGTITDKMGFFLCGDYISISKLSDALLDVEKQIVIGDNNSVRIYNSVIIADEIVFNSNNIEIEAKEPGRCLIVSKKDVINRRGEVLHFEIRCDKSELIKIDVPNIENYYMLRKFKYKYEESDASDYLKFNLFVKKIMNCMRKHRKDTPAKDREFIDNEIINKSMFKRDVMDFLIDIGVIYIDSKEPHLYKLDVAVLAQHGLNWMDFGGSVDDELTELYEEYSKKK